MSSYPPQPPGSYPPQPPGGYPPPNPPGYGPPPPYPQGGGFPPYQQYATPQPGQPGYQWGSGMPQYPYADFGQRFLALLLDGLIIFGILIVVFIFDVIVRAVTTRAFGGFVVLFLDLAAIVLAILYEPLLTARQGAMNGQTVGMHVMHIRITNLQGGPISTGQAWGRAIFRNFISGSIFWLGYLWMLWDPGKQTWHDKVANTLVLKA